VRIGIKYIEVLADHNTITLDEWAEKILETYPEIEEEIKKSNSYKENSKDILKKRIYNNTDIKILRKKNIIKTSKTHPKKYFINIEKYDEYYVTSSNQIKGKNWSREEKIAADTYLYIRKLLWEYTGVVFEINTVGKISPKNFQLITKAHAKQENISNLTKRMSYEMQVKYIKSIIELQNSYYRLFENEKLIDNEAMEEIFKLLKTVY
jgi:uncharacterized protein YqfB (UPF0267 family)